MARLKAYISYLKAVKGPIGAALFYAVIFGISTGIFVPGLVKYIFPLIFEKQLQAGEVVFIAAAAIPLAFFLRAFSSYRNSYYTQLAGVRILEAVRLDYFRKLQMLPLSFLQNKSTGDLISRGLSDTAQLQSTLTLVANDGVKQPFVLISAIAYLVTLAYAEAGAGIVMVCLTIIPLSVFPVRYVGRKVLKRAAQLQGHLGSMTGLFAENLSAAREVRAFSMEERETNRFREQTRNVLGSQMKIAKYALALTPTIEFVSAIGIAVTLAMAYDANIKLETFMSIMTALYMCYDPIKKIGYINSEIKRATASLDRIELVLKAPLVITDPEHPVEVGRLKGTISFEGLSFAYNENDYVLREINISIPAGTSCALVGPSGAGKSTFANLVPRFYEAGSGRVAIDGINVRDMRVADLRRNIALVSQEPILFNDTIANNILIGRPDATREEIEQAARDAFAHDFILAQPEGYETIVGERGSGISGGQKQRIAIARAFLRNAPILILDEATSALDTESEQAIQLALKKLQQGKTVLTIAHRFSTIRNASMILVFDQGRIVAQGNHPSLYASNPLYKKLYDGQNATGGQS
jgi:subfamily B ATP-binding cassette protein MsbA